MTSNDLKVIDTVDLVDSNDEDEVKIIGQGTKRKIIEVDLNEDVVIGVVDGAVSVPDCVKKLKKNENKSAREEKGEGQLVDYVVDDISPYHWTPDMKKFYNKLSPKKLKYSIGPILNSMPNGPNLWRVQGYPKYLCDKRSQICFNCGNYGHDERKCKACKCYMCGTEGHKVKHCPNRKCLTCGKTTPSSYVATCAKCLEFKARHCSRCKLSGHSLIDCTDHWRRFHNVTTLQRIEPPPGNIYKDSRNLWCCNCGRKGHVHEHCYATGDFSPFAPTSTFVASYDRAFPGDQAEAKHEPLCDYVLCTARDKVMDKVPDSRPREKFKPAKKLTRYFEPENNSARPPIASSLTGVLNGRKRRGLRKKKKLENLEAEQNLQHNVIRKHRGLRKKKQPLNLEPEQNLQHNVKRKHRGLRKKKQPQNLEPEQILQNQPWKKKEKPRFEQPFQDQPVQMKKKKLDQTVENQPFRLKQKPKRNAAGTAIAINRWNNFLMGITKI